jgi:pimeloyl-ACP methyl ester carboxylesterase
METVRHDGRETAYRLVGDGSPRALYVHGSGATHSVWAAQYAPRGPTPSAVALALSGHGESDDVDTAPGPATLDAYVADVVAVARVTDASILVGNSLGGAVALQTALESDLELDALVLAGTGAKLTVAAPLRELLADDFERAVDVLHGDDRLFHDADPDVVERSKAQLRATGRAVTERDFLTCHAFDVRDSLDEIAVPSLALVGEYDSLTPPEYHEFLAERMPDCEYAEVPDAAHLAMVERPDAFNEAVSSFLQRCR